MDNGKCKNNAKRIVVEDQEDNNQFSVGNSQLTVVNELKPVLNNVDLRMELIYRNFARDRHPEFISGSSQHDRY